MKILAIDTSNRPMTIALVEDDLLMATTTLNAVRNHSTCVLPTIDRLMATVGWQPTDLERVVVANGPGSYTGIRIATTTAKVMAASSKVDLVTISSLKVVAANIAPVTAALVVPFFDARRGNVFAGTYYWRQKRLISLKPDRHIAMSALVKELAGEKSSVLLLGTLTPQLMSSLTLLPSNVTLVPAVYSLPTSYQLALLGAHEVPVTDIDAVVPNYLRITEAEARWRDRYPDIPDQDYVHEI